MLKVSKLDFNLYFPEGAYLERWLGSVFRGGLGYQIRTACCIYPKKDCEICNTKDDCLFYYVYYNQYSRRGHAPPVKPIVLIPPFFGRIMYFKRNCTLNVSALLFGDFHRYLPHLLLCMRMLGNVGIGRRPDGRRNHFEVKDATCYFSHKKVFDGIILNVKNLKIVKIQDLYPVTSSQIRVGFRTPYTGKVFPPSPGRFIQFIRNRLIRYVNEYGDGGKVHDIRACGEITEIEHHFHRLERRSSRIGKHRLVGHTGIVGYKFTEFDSHVGWLLRVGEILGLGPDSSFGCGFIKYLNLHQKHKIYTDN